MSSEVVERRKKKVEEYLEKMREKILRFMGEDKRKFERFKTALLNIAMDGKLSGASLKSILVSAIQLAEIDLPLSSSLGLCYIVKYKKEAQPVISYKGWKVLLRRANIAVKERVVYDVDKFEARHDGFEDSFNLFPNFFERNEGDIKWVEKHFKGVWVAIKFIDNGEVQNWFVGKDKITQLKNLSPALRAKKGFSPYETGWVVEMYIAKAIGWVARRIGVDLDFMERAFEIENKYSDLKTEEREYKETGEDIFDTEIVEFEDEEEQGESSKEAEAEGKTGETKEINNKKEEREEKTERQGRSKNKERGLL